MLNQINKNHRKCLSGKFFKMYSTQTVSNDSNMADAARRTRGAYSSGVLELTPSF
jgi:hypothetical protein